ncbi:MAG TPA: polymer-forming cytoskeletal protein [Candidatus Babeliaceae bacterium]|nr:polymer-forming cytoskeletal protein [Candidatus Babeliaceae bacterium]
MFKFTKSFLSQGIQKDPTPFTQESYVPETDFGPEMAIGASVTVIGKIVFQREIHIEGVFEGEFEGNGKIIIGPEGFVKADIDVQEAEISGKVEGNITVKHRLILRGNAEVKGNITAPRLTVDEGVSIIGQVYVTAQSFDPQ